MQTARLVNRNFAMRPNQFEIAFGRLLRIERMPYRKPPNVLRAGHGASHMRVR